LERRRLAGRANSLAGGSGECGQAKIKVTTKNSKVKSQKFKLKVKSFLG
jgi:uncharacterized 2Fe-2S/4Fe-4S cluster protein (DUF4445 family)